MTRKRWIAALSGTGLLAFLLCWPWPVHSQIASLTMAWTSPGDDGNVGTATLYRMRAWTSRPDTTSQAARDAAWAAGTVVSGLPAPQIAGTAQTASATIPGGFITGRTYFFVIRTEDESGNLSNWSNVAWRVLPDTIPPAPIVDLRVN